MAERVTVHHLTPPRRLPLIEEDGLRTRGEMSRHLGEIDAFDAAARGRLAHGKRISAWLDADHARSTADRLGKGLVEFTVDPRRAQAAPASLREDGDPQAYWAAARPLRDWLAEGEVPDDLEVHVDRPVRVKHLTFRAPLLEADDLGIYADLVAEVADEDRLSAKALMHLAILAAEGDFDSEPFLAACALAWRDEPDPDGLLDELQLADPDKVASAALAMYGGGSEAVTRLREVLEDARAKSDEAGIEHGEGLYTLTAAELQQLEEHV